MNRGGTGLALPSLGLLFPMHKVSESPGSRSGAAMSPQDDPRGGAAAERPTVRSGPPLPHPLRERGRARARSHLAAAEREGWRAGPKSHAPLDPPPPSPGQSEGTDDSVGGDALGAGPAGAEERARGRAASGGRAEAAAAAGPGIATQRGGGRDRARQAPHPAAAAASLPRAGERGGERAACEGGRSGGRGAAQRVLSGGEGAADPRRDDAGGCGRRRRLPPWAAGQASFLPRLPAPGARARPAGRAGRRAGKEVAWRARPAPAPPGLAGRWGRRRAVSAAGLGSGGPGPSRGLGSGLAPPAPRGTPVRRPPPPSPARPFLRAPLPAAREGGREAGDGTGVAFPWALPGGQAGGARPVSGSRGASVTPPAPCRGRLRSRRRGHPRAVPTLHTHVSP